MDQPHYHYASPEIQETFHTQQEHRGYQAVDHGFPSPTQYDSTAKPEYSNYQHEAHQVGLTPPTSGHSVVQGQHWQSRPQEHRPVLRVWTWEILSLFLAIGLIGAIVGILAHFDGLTSPDWPYSINLNTLIALLSTVFRATMLLIVTEVIGQIKWSWFANRPRPLQHLNEFDQAGRSVLGSLRLIGTVFTDSNSAAGGVALVAALITVISFAVGPFMQQAIKAVPCIQVVATTNSSLPVVNYMPGTSGYYRVGAGLWEVDVDMKGAMINGLTNPHGNDSAVKFVCPTGNCTFPDYGTGVTHASLGLCSKCIDTTSFVKGKINQNVTTIVNLTLPDGPWINYQHENPWLNVRASNLSFASSAFTPDFASIASNAMFNFSMLTISNSTCSNSTGKWDCGKYNASVAEMKADSASYVAASCSLYPCLRSYAGSVKDGLLEERLVSTVPASAKLKVGDLSSPDDAQHLAYNWTAMRSPCMVKNKIYTTTNMTDVPKTPDTSFAYILLDDRNVSVPEQCLYKMYGTYVRAMYLFMSNTLFDGLCVYDSRQSYHLWCQNEWWLSPLYRNKNATFQTLSSDIDAFVTVVSNKFRSTGDGPLVSRGEDPRAVMAEGDVFQTTICTFFDWKWMLLPVGLALGSVALLGWMIVLNYQDQRQMIWKSSVVPLLFYGLRGGRQEIPRPAMELDAVEDEAKRTVVTFRNGPEPAFVGPPPVMFVPDPHLHSRPGNKPRDINVDSLLDYSR